MHKAAIWAPYCGAAPLPVDIWSRWNFDPVLIALLVAAAIAWLRLPRPHGMERRCFAFALAALAVIFISPLCALSSALFSARTVHHLLLVAVAAPLVALAWPAVGRRLSLAATTGIHVAVFWLWHVPSLYAWALSSDAAYWLMQASLFGFAFAFWAAAVGSAARTPQVAVAFIVMIAQMGLLGALITFAPSPLYAPHWASTDAWGLNPLEDQQLAGLIMWVGSLPIYLAAALAVLAKRLPSQSRGATA